MKIGKFWKWMYPTPTIWNSFKLLRTFFDKWLKWRSYSPFAYMLMCNFTTIDGRLVNSIVFCRKFINELRLYTFNIQFYIYDNLIFSFLLWKKLHLYFVTLLLPVSIYLFSMQITCSATVRWDRCEILRDSLCPKEFVRYQRIQ